MSDKGNVSDPKDVPGGSAGRVRTQSECSLGSDNGSSSNVIGKRQRTTSQTFMVATGLTAASPPKFVSLEEIMQAANSMKDMALVHEIVIDNEFKLKRYEPEDGLHKAVKENMHKAFWSIFRSEIAEDPPNFERPLACLEEIKELLFNLLFPQHTKLRQQIEEVLDIPLIKQQAEQGILDVKYYSQYIISVMAKLCAPVRDEKIKELSEITDIADTFKGILELLDLMALDMANFTITFAKPEIIAHSVQLERKKFADYLAVNPDGLELTRKWLLKHLDTSVTPPNGADPSTFARTLMKDTLTKAVIELLEWNPEEPYPETCMLDNMRLKQLQIHMERAVYLGTILLIIASNVGTDLNALTSFKVTIKEHCSIILQSYKSESDVKDLLPNIAAQAVKIIKDVQKEHNLPELSEQVEKILVDSILDVQKEDHKIKCLVKQRIKEFFQQIISSNTAAPQKVPSGLTALQQELTTIAGQYLRIITYNTTVFSSYYDDIIKSALKQHGQLMLTDGQDEQL